MWAVLGPKNSLISNPLNISVFCFWSVHPQTLAVDALTISLENLYAYVYPPIYPIPKILQYIRQFHCQIILIAPQWGRIH
jgi:hypothetical protein